MISNVSRLADMNEALTSGLAPYVRHRLEELLKERRIRYQSYDIEKSAKGKNDRQKLLTIRMEA